MSDLEKINEVLKLIYMRESDNGSYIRLEGKNRASAELVELLRAAREEAWTEAIYHAENFVSNEERRALMADNPYLPVAEDS